MTGFSGLLRRRMDELGLNERQVAKAVGYNDTRIHRLKHGTGGQPPRELGDIARFAAILEVDSMALLGLVIGDTVADLILPMLEAIGDTPAGYKVALFREDHLIASYDIGKREVLHIADAPVTRAVMQRSLALGGTGS